MMERIIAKDDVPVCAVMCTGDRWWERKSVVMSGMSDGGVIGSYTTAAPVVVSSVGEQVVGEVKDVVSGGEIGLVNTSMSVRDGRDGAGSVDEKLVEDG